MVYNMKERYNPFLGVEIIEIRKKPFKKGEEGRMMAGGRARCNRNTQESTIKQKKFWSNISTSECVISPWNTHQSPPAVLSLLPVLRKGTGQSVLLALLSSLSYKQNFLSSGCHPLTPFKVRNINYSYLIYTCYKSNYYLLLIISLLHMENSIVRFHINRILTTTIPSSTVRFDCKMFFLGCYSWKF